jgi:O-antigen biosynthesis protein
MLSHYASKVIGVDISHDAVSHANLKYNNVEFKQGSCSSIPVEDNSIDVVVSFETIEHHDEHDLMMAEIKRVLKKDGILILSSPDKMEYSDKPNYVNPFHVKELYKDELVQLLNSNFKYNSILGQRIIYGSALFDLNNPTKVEHYQSQDNFNNQTAQTGIFQPIYFITVSSDIELPPYSAGLYEQDIQKSELVRFLKRKEKRMFHINIPFFKSFKKKK